MASGRSTGRAPAPELDLARWILWEDEGLAAIDKPAGVLSQGGEGGEGVNVVDLARAHFGRAGIGVLHRIDRNVSGIVLVAKEHRTASAMTRLFAKGEVERVYRAVVRGRPARDALVFDAWLAKDPARNEVRAARGPRVFPGTKLGPPAGEPFRPARTEATVVRRFVAPLGACASLDVRPITGRSHQIRVHLADGGLPIVGDPKYGVPARDVNRPLLHAMRLVFRHPRTRDVVTIESALPWTDDALLRLEPVTERRAPGARNRRSTSRGR